MSESSQQLTFVFTTPRRLYYTQGQYDFVDVVDAPNPEAVLAFSVWYANKGFGRLQSMPAFDEKAMDKAVKRA